MASGCTKSGCGCLSGLIALGAGLGVCAGFGDGRWDVVAWSAIAFVAAVSVANACVEKKATADQIKRAKSLGMLLDPNTDRDEAEDLIAEIAAIASPDDEELANDSDEPTHKQREFAKRLGLTIRKGMTKWQVSDLIDGALQARKKK